MNDKAILVMNAGSSSLKMSLFVGDVASDSTGPAWQMKVDGRGKYAQVTVESEAEAPHTSVIDARDEDSLEQLFEAAWSGNHAVIADPLQIESVGHRVVHGGRKYSESVFVDDAVIRELRSLIELAPLHEKASIKGIKLAQHVLPHAAQVAVFDTAYHHDMPLSSAVYAAPYHWYEKLGIRRYGFHGINHQYCARRAQEMLAARSPSRIITCHLGSGGSLCASLSLKSIMTTMGYTPLAGLVMRTRCGSIDPGIILHLLHQNKFTPDELLRILDEESGLKGISGLSGDMREIEKEVAAGNPRAKLALDIYEQNLAANIAALVPTLGGLDALVFTGGIGENSALVRSLTCQRLRFLGVRIDESKNHAEQKIDRDISAPAAEIAVLVIPAREDLAVARECSRLMQEKLQVKR